MNITTITRPLALIAVGALALAGCSAAESDTKPEPAPAETVYVEVEPEPEPEPEPVVEDDWTESDEFIELAMELAWAETSAEEREDVCWGIDALGEDWFAEIWDEETSGAPAPLAYAFFEEKCS